MNRREYQRNLMRQRRENANEIGELPKVANPSRRRKAEASLALWGETYALATDSSAGLLLRPPSAKLKEYAATLQRILEGTGALHVRCARGAGKTTWVSVAILYGLATGRIRFATVFAASADLASAILQNLWTIIEGNETFAADYPEIAYPVAVANGIYQRFLTQTYKGTRTAIKHTSREIKLPTIAGAKSSGGLVIARGAGSATRGLIRGGRRPDCILLDDLQTRKIAESPARVKKLEDWINGDVRGLQGASLTRLAITSTPIAKNDLSETLADPQAHPEFLHINFPLLLSPPSDSDAWTEYDRRYKQSIREGDPNFTKATEYYRANREAMDAGAELLDPSAFDERLELSALQHARNLLLTMGLPSFRTEYQLKPKEPDSALTLTARQVASRCNGVPRGILPKQCLKVIAAIDVNTVAGLSYVIAGFGRKQTCAVLDYGRITGPSGRLVPKNASTRETERILSKALYSLIVKLHSTPIKTETGKTIRPGAIWVDRGFLPKVIDAVCELAQKNGHPAASLKGYDSRAFTKYSKSIVARTGDGVDLREWEGKQYHGVNADVAKEQAQSAFLSLPLLPGSVSLFGNDPSTHADFAEEITNESLAEKVQGAEVTFYNWTSRPNAPNHFLDALAYCIAAAKWFRFWEGGDLIEEAGESSPSASKPRARAVKTKRKKIVLHR